MQLLQLAHRIEEASYPLHDEVPNLRLSLPRVGDLWAAGGMYFSRHGLAPLLASFPLDSTKQIWFYIYLKYCMLIFGFAFMLLPLYIQSTCVGFLHEASARLI
jgi:hypothetical protein